MILSNGRNKFELKWKEKIEIVAFWYEMLHEMVQW